MTTTMNDREPIDRGAEMKSHIKTLGGAFPSRPPSITPAAHPDAVTLESARPSVPTVPKREALARLAATPATTPFPSRPTPPATRSLHVAATFEVIGRLHKEKKRSDLTFAEIVGNAVQKLNAQQRSRTIKASTTTVPSQPNRRRRREPGTIDFQIRVLDNERIWFEGELDKYDPNMPMSRFLGLAVAAYTKEQSTGVGHVS